MAGRRRSLTAMLTAAVLMWCCADASGATITVVQIGATRGAGQQQVDKRLAALEKKLSRLPYNKFEWLGEASKSTAYGKMAVLPLKGATPTREGDRIGLAAELLKGSKSVLNTTLRVRPGRVGFLIHSGGKRDVILAVRVE